MRGEKSQAGKPDVLLLNRGQPYLQVYLLFAALEGQGHLVADLFTFQQGEEVPRAADGLAVDAAHIEFGPGPFVVDVAADGTFAAVFNGRLVTSG